MFATFVQELATRLRTLYAEQDEAAALAGREALFA